MPQSGILLFLISILSYASLQAQSITEIEAEVFRLINDHRESIGIKPLIKDEVVAQQARQHSTNMAHGKIKYGHKGYKERFGAIRRAISCGAMAENVTRTISQSVAENAVRSWLASEGHRQNLEDSQYTLTGVGVAKNKYNEYYLTQIFAAKDLKYYQPIAGHKP